MKDLEKQEEMLDLLIAKAATGLSDEEAKRLKELESAFPEFAGDDSFELAAAAVGLVNLKPDEQMPAHLQTKILAEADKFFAAKQREEPSPTSSNQTEEFQKTFSFEPKSFVRQWLGWAVAAAACLALALNIWMTRFQTQRDVVRTPPVTPTPAKLTPAEEREQFLSSAGDIVKTEWVSPDPKAAGQISGDIVWSDTEQKGYMRFRGLPVNDISRETYQLWIFDETQDEKTPIDGGIFDVPQTGEIIIPVDARLKVKNPKMFAVTVEKPGGAVVSNREKIAAIAKV